jgi:AcrR family transcriptional regulator
MPRPPNPNLRDDLLAAAIVLLETRGPAFSIRDLAASIQYSTTAIYQCFSNRADLLKAVQLRLFEELAGQLHPPPSDAGDVSDRIIAIGSAFVTWALAHPTRYEFMFHNMEPDALLEGAERTLAQLPLAVLEGLLTEGMQTGELKAGNAKLLALMLFSGLHGLVSLHAAKRIQGFTDADPVDVFNEWAVMWLAQLQRDADVSHG